MLLFSKGVIDMVGENLKKVRKEHKLTQQDIANVLGIDRSTYTFYETGKTNPSINTIYKLAEIYNVTIGYLLGVEDSAAENRKKNVSMSVAAPETDHIAYLDKDEQMLLMCYRIISDEYKQKAVEMMKDFARKTGSDMDN